MKVCVGLSGGVDSSVAALLLKQQGYDVFAMFMQNWHETEGTLHGDCEWEEDRFVAEMVARKIGIPFYFVDLSKQYRQRVVDYMFDEYSRGRTPNPDVLCNREIKFDAFLQAARSLGADTVATGHYCRKESVIKDGKEIFRLLAGTDPGKDQSYFLCQLSQEQLSHALFPIGHLLKSEVRQIAKEADLPSADKKDSQGICFVGKVDLPVFLQQKLESNEGEIIEVFDAFYDSDETYAKRREALSSLLEDGCEPALVTSYISEDKQSGAPERLIRYDPVRLAAAPDEVLDRLSADINYGGIVFETETYRSGKHHVKKTRYRENPFGRITGVHEGAQFYTIGQRKGLNVGGHKEPLFVIGTDTILNRVYVGEGHSHKGLSKCALKMDRSEIHWIREDLKTAPGEIRRYKLRIRYRQPLQDAFLIDRSSGIYILFDAPQRGITPGQFAAWYSEDGELVGSGVI